MIVGKVGAQVALLLLIAAAFGCTPLGNGSGGQQATTPRPAVEAPPALPPVVMHSLPPPPAGWQTLPSPPVYSRPLPPQVKGGTLPRPPRGGPQAVELTSPVPQLTISTGLSTVPVKVGAFDPKTGFGYVGNMLRAKLKSGAIRQVSMMAHAVDVSFECTGIFPGTQHVAKISMVVMVQPSELWEREFHRLVSTYVGVSKSSKVGDVVTTEDVATGAIQYIRPHFKSLCDVAEKKKVTDMLKDPSLDVSAVQTALAGKEKPFVIIVTSAQAELPPKAYRAILHAALAKDAK